MDNAKKENIIILDILSQLLMHVIILMQLLLEQNGMNLEH